VEYLGKYKILGEIGAGAMGVVYKGLHPLMKRVVAVKTMSSNLTGDPQLRTRFFREAEAVAQLSHRNIITVYDMGEEGGQLYLTMEFLEGEDLKAKLAKKKPDSLEDRLNIVAQVCEGMAHAHGKGVIHRDIKPGNIFVTDSGDVKILDFGLARLAESDLTGSGEKMGTPSYMSPEQLSSSKIDHRSDIYSAGVVFYELFTFTRLFYADSLHAVFFKIINSVPDPVEKVNPHIPHELSEIVRRAIEKDPERRYQSMADLRADLQEFRVILEDLKRTAVVEARQALAELDKVIQDNLELLQESGEQLRHLKEDPPTMLARLASGGRGESTASRSYASLGYLEILEIRDRARREYQRQCSILEKRRQAIPLLREAASLEQKGEYEEALRVVEKVLSDDASYVEAKTARQRISATLEERRLQEQQRKRIAELFLDAGKKLDAGDLTGCVTLAGELLALDPGHAQAQELRENARRELAAQAELADRKRKANEALAAARAALVVRDFEKARAAAGNAQSMFPEHAEARRLLEEIAAKEEEYRLRRERQLKIARLMEEVSALQEKADEDGALKVIDEVLALDATHAGALRIKSKLAEARAARKTAEDLYEQAARRFASGDAAACIPLLTKALRLFPGREDAEALLKNAKAQLERQARIEEERQQVDHALSDVREALLAENLEDARKFLERARALSRSADVIAAVSGEIERLDDQYRKAVERSRRIKELVSQARASLRAGNDASAQAAIHELELLAPASSQAVELFGLLRQSQEDRERAQRERLKRIAEYFSGAQRAEIAQDFEPALKLARAVVSEDEAHAGARELILRVENQIAERKRADERKKQRAAALLETARRARADKRYEQALQALAEIVSLGETTEEVNNLQRTTSAEFEKEKNLQAQRAEGERQKELGAKRLNSKQYQESLSAFLRAKELLGDDPVIHSGIAEAEEGIRVEERLTKIKTLLARARQSVSQEEYGQAGQTASEVLRLDSRNEEAKELQLKIEEGQERKRKRTEIAALLAQGRGAFGKDQFEEAVRCGTEVLFIDPQNAEAKELLAKVEQGQNAKRRREKLASLLARGNEAYKHGELGEAETRVRELLMIDAQNAEARELLKQIDKALQEKSKKDQISSLLSRAQNLHRQRDLINAAQAVKDILALDSSHKEAKALLKDLEKEQKTEEMERQILRKQQFKDKTASIAAALTQEEKTLFLGPYSVFGLKLPRAATRMTAYIVLPILIISMAVLVYRSIRQPAENPNARESQELFNRGKYDLAAQSTARWLQNDPGNNGARELKAKIEKAQNAVELLKTALRDVDYPKASSALVQLEGVNPFDPGVGDYRRQMEQQFSASFGDQFKGDLSQWTVPATWRIDKGKLLVGEGMGWIRVRHFKDFTANFNIEFVTGDTAAWLIRAADPKNYYRFILTGPKGIPANSFSCVKVLNGQEITLLTPTNVGMNLGLKDDQIDISVKVSGTNIKHFIKSVLDPSEEGAKELPAVVDAAIGSGTLGFAAGPGISFHVLAPLIEPAK
jgi:serine/threonine protein kinase/tetratricopeptide (TPR) repeat protein